MQDDPTIFSLTSHGVFVLHHYQYGVQRASFHSLNPVGKVEVVCCVRMGKYRDNCNGGFDQAAGPWLVVRQTCFSRISGSMDFYPNLSTAVSDDGSYATTLRLESIATKSRSRLLPLV